jgi:hypothetical protein
LGLISESNDRGSIIIDKEHFAPACGVEYKYRFLQESGIIYRDDDTLSEEKNYELDAIVVGAAGNGIYRPKTTVSPASCEYMIAESKPIIKKCTLMIGTHSDQESAEALVRKLARDGFSARVEKVANQFVVYVGLFISTQDANTVERELTDSGYASALILLE